MSLGFDVGTFSLICAKRNKKEIEFNKGINSFVEIPLENRFLFNMMKNSGVPLIERDNMGYVLGEAAVIYCSANSGKKYMSCSQILFI